MTLTIGVLLDELVESHASSAGLRDASTSSLGELESGDCHLGHLKDALVVSDGGDDDSGGSLANSLISVMLDELGQRERRLVDPRGHKSSQDHSPSTGFGPPRHEPEQLDEQVDIEVGAASVFLVRILNSTSFNEIDSLKYE